MLLPVKRGVPRHLENYEARSLLAATAPLYRDMVLAALTTGFRRGELLGLKWEDVNFGTSRIRLQRQLQSRREGQWLVGYGMASVRYSWWQEPS